MNCVDYVVKNMMLDSPKFFNNRASVFFHILCTVGSGYSWEGGCPVSSTTVVARSMINKESYYQMVTRDMTTLKELWDAATTKDVASLADSQEAKDWLAELNYREKHIDSLCMAPYTSEMFQLSLVCFSPDHCLMAGADWTTVPSDWLVAIIDFFTAMHKFANLSYRQVIAVESYLQEARLALSLVAGAPSISFREDIDNREVVVFCEGTEVFRSSEYSTSAKWAQSKYRLDDDTLFDIYREYREAFDNACEG